MKVLFVRHSESLNNIVSLKHGKGNISLMRQDDPTITEKGEKQAHRLGCFLKEQNIKISQIRTSPYLRTLQTTQMIKKGLQDQTAKVKVERILHEKKGCYFWKEPKPGLPRSKIQEIGKDWEVEDSIGEEGWNAERKTVETFGEVKIRAKGLLEKLKQKAKNREYEKEEFILLVSHGSFLTILFMMIQGMRSNDSHKYNPIMLDNTSLSLLEFQQSGEVKIVFQNITPHLSD